MDIKTIDRNFEMSFTPPNDVWFLSALEAPFCTYGVRFCHQEGLFRRIPREVAEATSEGVSRLSYHTSGGRIRFVTDSPYIIVHVEEPFEVPFSHMTVAGKCGVSLYANRKFVGTVMPSYEQIVAADPARGGSGTIVFDGIKYPYKTSSKPYTVDLFLPLYSAVKSVHIGVRKGTWLQSAPPYQHQKPVLFYGSSITQGGCASKPGDDYVGRICRALDVDVINLGFSGNAKGEATIAEYIAAQDPAVFVLDYDHNAPSAEHLQKTHYALYKTVRDAHPTTPIVLMTMPTIEGYENRPANSARRAEIFGTLERAKESGDTNVYLVDCYGCFGEAENGECGTVDDCHPNSLGFLRMYERVLPLLKTLLNKE